MFADEIVETVHAFPSLLRLRLASGSESGAMGDAFVEFISDTVRVPFVRDRGQLSLDIGPLGQHDWYDSAVLNRLLGRTEPRCTASAGSDGIPTIVEFLARDVHRIETLFTSASLPQTLASLAAIERDSFRRRFGIDP